MMSNPIFCSLSSSAIASKISSARSRVCLVSPGIHESVAKAILDRSSSLAPENICIRVDFSDETLRMGFGSLEAVDLLRNAEIEVGASPGIRTGILIVDEQGWFFTPTPLYLESEPQSDETPNAIRLDRGQIAELLPRIFPPALEAALADVPEEEKEQTRAAVSSEIGAAPVSQAEFDFVEKSIKLAPPVKFNLARQVRVFEPYLQYIEMSLKGASIQRRTVQLPTDLQEFGEQPDIKDRLHLNFDLVGKRSGLTSGDLDRELAEIRKTYTRSLGEGHGRVMLKAKKANLEKRLNSFHESLDEYRKHLREKLQEYLNEQLDSIVSYFLPLVQANPPEQLTAEVIGNPDNEQVEGWLRERLGDSFPAAEKLISEISMTVIYKDVTFETLNEEDFFEKLKAAFPRIDWEKPYHEFKAAGQDS